MYCQWKKKSYECSVSESKIDFLEDSFEVAEEWLIVREERKNKERNSCRYMENRNCRFSNAVY